MAELVGVAKGLGLEADGRVEKRVEATHAEAKPDPVEANLMVIKATALVCRESLPTIAAQPVALYFIFCFCFCFCSIFVCPSAAPVLDSFHLAVQWLFKMHRRRCA